MRRRVGRTSLVRDLLPFAAVLAMIIGALLAATFLYVRLSDGIRGYVNGESLWTKAQKRAVFELDEYGATGDPEDLATFREALEVPLAYRRAREGLLEAELDRAAVREAFLDGGSHPDDVAQMILVARWFRPLDDVRNALEIWAAGDTTVAELRDLARALETAVEERGPESAEATALTDRLRSLDQRFTDLERRFSATLGEVDRRLSRSFLALLASMGLLLLVLGVGVTRTLLSRIRASEEAIRDREERLRLVTRATNDVVWDYDPTSGEIEWSEALSSNFGYDPSRVDGDMDWWEDRVHADDRERVLTKLEEVLASSRDSFASEYRFRRADGSYAVVYDRGYVVRDEEGAPVRMIGSTLDLTENREIERALRRSEARYRELMDQASDAIMILDPELTVAMANGMACEILGYEREALVGRDVRELISPESLEQKPLRIEAVQRGDTVVVERDVVRRDGSRIPMEFSTRQLEDGRIQTIGRDVRKRRELEARVRQAEKMEAVGRLAGGIAHDFNNLLTAIRGYTQLLLAELDPDDPNRDDVREADRAAERAGALVSQLLVFSRRQPTELRLVDVNVQLRTMEQMLQRLSGEHIDVVLELEPDVVRIRIDPVQVEQVVLNLLLNARDAMPRGGAVRIETAEVVLNEKERPSVTGELPPGRYLRLRVRDNGAGMDARTVDRIFEPFYSGKESSPGRGLGLATVYGIVDQADGGIGVDSEVGRGSTFDVYLPGVGDVSAEA